MRLEKPIFRLFACCRPVRGARRSLICDLQRQTYSFIPNGLYDVLTQHDEQTVDEIKGYYDHVYDDVIDQYFAFLIEEEYGFWCDDPDLFPDLDLTWQRPEQMTHAIIDVDAGSAHNFERLLTQLDDLGCKALQVRFYCPCTIDMLTQPLEYSRCGRLRSIELMFPYCVTLTEDVLSRLIHNYPRLSRLFVHSAPHNRVDMVEGVDILIHYHMTPLDGPQSCGEVNPEYFITNIELFSESQQYNSCLNGKLSIDACGEIKACPSMKDSFGHTRDTSLREALTNARLRQLWSINKDQIDVCKDCEFRYICTDCRAYVTEPDHLFAKPSKCHYDPYTAQWRR